MSSEDFVASDNQLIVFLHLKPLNQAAQMREKDGLSQENLFGGFKLHGMNLWVALQK